MSATSRDLASRDLWEASLQRSRARRQRISVSMSSPQATGAKPAPGAAAGTRHAHAPRTRTGRDLSDPEPWVLSSGRSHIRRRAAELQVVSGSTRAKRLSVGALAALTAGPALTVAEASAASSDTNANAEVPTTTEHTVVITPGSSGRHVRALQRALGLPSDGVFGAHTHAAVHHFQARHGLRRDGVVGARTAAALRRAAPSATHEAPAATAAPPALAAAARHTRAGLRARAAADAGGAMYEGPAVSGAVAAPHSMLPTAQTPNSGADQITAAPQHGAPASHSAPGPRPAAPVRVSETGGSAVQDTTTHAGSNRSASSSDRVTAGVAAVVAAGSRIARLPYRYGGGHGSFRDNGYDCSGSVSYALHGAGLISSPEDSTSLESYGLPGPGKHITIYANSAHAFMTVDGRRFDTVALGQTGSRWSSQSTSTAGFVARHPAGY